MVTPRESLPIGIDHPDSMEIIIMKIDRFD
jgi:hypothetical protein